MAQTPQPQPQPQSQPQAQAQPPQPQRPPASRVVQYGGIIVTTTGHQVAFVTMRDPATRKSSTGFLGEGQKRDGIEVTGFTEQALEIKTPAGANVSIPLGRQQKVLIE